MDKTAARTMQAAVVGISWLVLTLFGLAGWPRSPEILFPRSNAGGAMLIGFTFGVAAVALVLLIQRHARWIALSGIVFTLGMLPFVGMWVEELN